MTDKQISTASKIFSKYIDKYPTTGLFELLPISTQIMNEVERYGELAENNIDTIIENTHKLMDKKMDLFDLFGISKPEKKTTETKKDECTCKKNEERLPSMEDVAKSNHVCKCSQNNQKTWVSDTEEMKTIKILVPGVKKENISLTVDEGLLIMKLKDVVIESAFVNPGLCISVNLDKKCNIDKMKASLDLGILTITIPKYKKMNTTKTIEIF